MAAQSLGHLLHLAADHLANVATGRNFGRSRFEHREQSRFNLANRLRGGERDVGGVLVLGVERTLAAPAAQRFQANAA